MNGIKQTFPAPPSYYLEENRTKPEPIVGDFIVFGEPDNVVMKLSTLDELGIPPLDIELNREDLAASLKIINHSLLLNFMQLLHQLVSDTSLAIQKTDHIRTLLIHFHHTINEYRPHQARDTLALILQQQLEKKNASKVEISMKCRAIQDTLSKLLQEHP